ncbi:MAG: phosphoenolpyruvate synthase, partial [Armatimonadia bacterium]
MTQTTMVERAVYVRFFEELGRGDVPSVGGKNASLGEMVQKLGGQGIRVPEGFATTAEAYRSFLEANGLTERIRALGEEFDSGQRPVAEVGREIRRLFMNGQFPEDIAQGIREAYRELSRRYGVEHVDVAVRSSATAEDLPEASFAGQQETFLNITGEEELLSACRRCYASLFTDRALTYRLEKGFDHMKVALSIGVQKMVRSDLASAGVLFTIDTETGFPNVVVINGSWGLGENVVKGAVNPDEYLVFKPLLEQEHLRPIVEKTLGSKRVKMIYAEGGTDTTINVPTSRDEQYSFALSEEEILQLARWGVLIEKHYGMPMDVEWAKDGQSGDLFIVQARPETVESRRAAGVLRTYKLKQQGERLVQGLAIGSAIASGKAQVIESIDQIDEFETGSILITTQTDPDWVPIMRRATGIVTDHGGRTSHAAIVSREFSIPAIVGTQNATEVLQDGEDITMSCAEGDLGYVYRGLLAYEAKDTDVSELPQTRTTVMLIIASPAAGYRWWRLPVRGIGLARMEFINNNIIKIHPMALLQCSTLPDRRTRVKIERLTRGYEDKAEYFVDNLARGIARIASAQYPEPVIVRMSDFKTNEYANLIGGAEFEPHEDNPMLGFRGASRYYSDRYRAGFALECAAIKRAREEMGFSNIIMMIPFCRTVEEADRVLEVMADNGLRRGENGLEVYVMAEIPSNVILAEQFADRFDGFSIGSNDLTQLVLGVDRDAADLAQLFDERNEAVTQMIRQLIERAHTKHRKVGLCGQAPSDHPEFAEFLVQAGIDSISVNPDSVVEVIKRVAAVE